ncbi:hypothetical protein [Paracoccus denitrificans]|jgi:hypothetical protein|uniref:Uncharacterized protein n=1 Tax=Paracoccus denitrificans (strain Pd 1222) TaxID=318586 RepID=A1B2S8_PARDP|nr:hypothetical protein [Paracoccus denitrificans]ABL69822.1 hypothetical protein Pden_1725 [Paracoccus denitrificans PD1222]MBB4629429.1 hypothetical protein [Paracoccus denitrificans]MCU7430906.1 hypothetical protein [Paracoccus denitrificans]QAR25223.1 hypothetical protein EO213_02175 [Paracoccus denitrificans]UPV94104.1 hypothetical protein M0K93_09475 [Paracoccus denitrificans]
MKHLLWVIIAAVLLLANVVVGGWTEIADLRRAREWTVSQAGEAGAKLRGVHVRVDQVWAGSAPNLSERALVLVRLALRGPEAARQGWAGCDLSLRDAADRVWLPLISTDSEGAVRVLSPDGENKGRCNPIPYDAPPDRQEFLSDQLFLVPSELLKGARLRVSAWGTRPEALEFAVKPVLRDLQ